MSAPTGDPWLGQREARWWRLKGWRCGWWRWHVAELLNRSPRTCGVSLVDWALAGRHVPWWRGWLPRFPRHYQGMDGERWRLSDVVGDSSSCRAEVNDLKLCGCYCGKIRRQGDA